MTTRPLSIAGIAAAVVAVFALSGLFVTIRAQSSNFFDSFDSSLNQQNDIIFPVPSPQPIPFPNDTSIAEYTQCMQSAIDEQESDLLQLHQMYHQRLEQLIERRWQSRRQIYAISDNKQRRNYEREVERFYRDARRDLERAFDDVEDSIMDRYRAAKRECDEIKRELEREARRIERDFDENNNASVFGPAPSTFQPSYAPSIQPLYQPSWTFSDNQTL